MNKAEFIDYIAEKHNCTKVEAERIINFFTSSVTSALAEGKDISFVGFGKFSTSKVQARTGRNPRTGKPLEVAAYIKPKFSAGQSLKDSCNKK